MKTVRVDVRVQSEAELKVVWNDDSAWLPYFISRKVVEDCAHEIRRVLAELVEAGLNGHLSSCGPILKRLADEGSTLHRALFTKTSGETDPERVRLRYERWSQPFRVRFCVSDSVFVPWGLVFSGDADDLPDEWPGDAAAGWEAYKNFWCLSRALSTVYDRIPPDAADDAEGASSSERIRGVRPDVCARAMNPLDSSAERSFLGWLTERHGEPLTTSRALKTRWRERSRHTRLVYFYCHASPTQLALGEDEKIEASRLLLLLAGKPIRPAGHANCLVLLNGCSTAVGSAAGDFLLSTSQDGLCGFVGTETEVPDIFALRFSSALLYRMFHKGESLGEAMQEMHRRHFPLSLVYGSYAHPDFAMPQTQVPEITDWESMNFSFGRIGTNRLGGRL